MVEQMIAVVQAYIFHRTEREVIITVNSNEDYIKLSHAYSFAINWFQQNDGQINQVK